MKRLLFVSALALVIVGGVTIWAETVLRQVRRRQQEVERAYRERAEDLRATNALFERAAGGALTPERVGPWLEVRRALAGVYVETAADDAETTLDALEARNDMLRALRRALEASRMSLAEYVALSARWRALVARPELAGMRRAWRETVYNEEHPFGEGLPLPEPAKDADEGEIALVKENAAALRATLQADLFGPLLERIAAGKETAGDGG